VNTELPHYRTLIESALAFAGNTVTYDDVVREVEGGEAQFWPGPNSCIVTQIDDLPTHKVLIFFLAAGNSAELKVMEPLVIQWGKEQGCVLARLAGRKGWKRSWVMEQGWKDTEMVILEKEML
jgi:hypothetical protein